MVSFVFVYVYDVCFVVLVWYALLMTVTRLGGMEGWPRVNSNEIVLVFCSLCVSLESEREKHCARVDVELSWYCGDCLCCGFRLFFGWVVR